MSDPAASAAEPTTAPDFAAFEASENRKALGQEPEPAPVAATAEPEPEGDEPEPEPTVATSATAEPAAPALSKRQQKELDRQQLVNDALRSKTEAEARAAKLEARLKELEGKAAPAAEPQKPEPIVDPKDPEPQESEFEDYRAFVKAQSRWEIRQAKREDDAAAKVEREKATADEQTQAIQASISTFLTRRDAYLAKTPAAKDRLMAFLNHGYDAGYVRPGTPIGDVLLESEVSAEVGDYLASNPQEVERIVQLAPVAALRALGRLEALFDSPPERASAGSAAKTVTTAPAPPMTLSARSASPADPSKAALERRDFSAFEAEENRKDIAAFR